MVGGGVGWGYRRSGWGGLWGGFLGGGGRGRGGLWEGRGVEYVVLERISDYK